MTVSEFVFEPQISNHEELDDENCGGKGRLFSHL